jgi:hypothetical protein
MASINDKVYNMITCLADQYGFDADEAMDTIGDKFTQENFNVLTPVSPPIWYRIPEIPTNTFLSLIKPLYDSVEGRKTSVSEPDRFAKDSWMAFHNKSEDEWYVMNKEVQRVRAWTMAWGIFHQNLMGSFPGWESYKRGHKTKCDIGTLEEDCVGEIKNNTNTMNADSKKSVISKLKQQKDLGKRVMLVTVNGAVPPGIPNYIENIDGKTFYEDISGRSNFMDDLHTTITDCFKQFKTYRDLEIALETP